MTNFGWDLPPGCSLADIDALCVEETPLVAYATDHYREEMITRLNYILDDARCVQIAIDELASHGHPNAAAWAVRDWLDAFGREMALRHVTEIMEQLEGSHPAPGKSTDLVNEVNATQKTIAECEYTDASARAAYTLGALTGMLKGMAGLHEFSTHPSCFDSETTEAVKRLLDAIS